MEWVVVVDEEGKGIKLRDIKKVSSNLRKREIDAALKIFHAILYGVKVKDKDLKRNILDFSGFLWGPQEEMIWGMPFWKVMQILEGKLELLNLRIPPLFVTL
ncbi:uncharacterized protein LOC120263057 [Dioscorea cayenensis subsp. rotundata]|uniref:Uncharacterized protein LOC120263057 n=1 Tax=Dioscorea cayennensis subsp. rotundata TaxID=55577 RepID=A0AB40BJD0_DIOCR|nr:uncharacterized protein LOC120263057 [Dioscorea cayenensis subsp. rotundata]